MAVSALLQLKGRYHEQRTAREPTDTYARYMYMFRLKDKYPIQRSDEIYLSATITTRVAAEVANERTRLKIRISHQHALNTRFDSKYN